MGERYEPWQPLDGTAGEFAVVWFEHRPATGAVLEVERLSGGPVLRVWFDGAVAFRQHPHDILMLSWWESHSFYRVLESSWATWLERESQGIWQAGTYTHYGCKTVDGCYEVLSAARPRAEWVAPESSLNPAARAESWQGEPSAAADGGGRYAFLGSEAQQPPPLLSSAVRRQEGDHTGGNRWS